MINILLSILSNSATSHPKLLEPLLSHENGSIIFEITMDETISKVLAWRKETDLSLFLFISSYSKYPTAPVPTKLENPNNNAVGYP